MVKLRFKRIGKKNDPSFRIVAVKDRSKRDGQVLEYLGFYNPRSKQLKLEKERIEYWLSKGAQPTDTLKNILIKQKLLKAPDKSEIKVFKKQPGKKKAVKAGKSKENKPAEKTAATEKSKVEAAPVIETKTPAAKEEAKV